jgi:hypothetical protein
MSDILQALGFDSPTAAKGKLFAAMKAHGIAYLEASYSGGNDEGGVDEITVMKDDRDKLVTIENLGWEHPLVEACDRMLGTEFGSWAGDFSAYGVLYANVTENKVSRKGSQSHYDEDGHEY